MTTTPYRRVDQQGDRRMADPSPTHQLDFYQAMADFRHMFPNMDEEVIEAVLRSNNGAVDATIDQLLTMNTDLIDGLDHKQPISSKSSKSSPSPADYKPNQPILDSSSSDGEDAPPPYPPPSYHDYTNLVPPDPPPVKQLPPDQPRASSAGTPAATDLMSASWKNDPLSWTNTTPSSVSTAAPPSGGHANQTVASTGGGGDSSMTDLLGAVGGASLLETTPKRAPTDFYGDAPPGCSGHVGGSPKKPPSGTPGKRTWNPPMVGDLPDDFLRIIPTPAQQAAMIGRDAREGGAVHAIRTNESTPVGSGRSSPAVSDRRRSPRRSASLHASRATGASPATSRRLNSDMEMLQQKLAENERRRQESLSAGVPVHPEEAQILEDERIALMLQNEEFLHELQEDEDFMRTLENDHMNATAFEPPQLDSPDLDPGRPRHVHAEGYGDDRGKALEAFPFDRETVAVEQDRHAELRRKLKNMGGTSKKKLQAAARKFFTRKKKKPSKQLIKGTGMPSTINLLEEEHSDTEEILTSRSRSKYDQGE